MSVIILKFYYQFNYPLLSIVNLCANSGENELARIFVLMQNHQRKLMCLNFIFKAYLQVMSSDWFLLLSVHTLYSAISQFFTARISLICSQP